MEKDLIVRTASFISEAPLSLKDSMVYLHEMIKERGPAHLGDGEKIAAGTRMPPVLCESGEMRPVVSWQLLKMHPGAFEDVPICGACLAVYLKEVL